MAMRSSIATTSGDLLMEEKRPAMELSPNRFNSLLGAFYETLLDGADGGTRQTALKEARKYSRR